ncbi:MAG: hypothetical protein E6G92_03330 [Alphaproteobacteria bacterium]|nr:MAG: hypothetical protein E6G92_03330 [Alphaproteobacteria bacterium]
MTSESARGASEAPPPGVNAVEHSFDRTHALLGRFREELAVLIHRVHRDVDRLREIALGEPGPTPWIDPMLSESAAEERRLAEMAREERAVQRTTEMVNELMDARFRTLTSLIDAKVKQNAGALQKLRSGASRGKP